MAGHDHSHVLQRAMKMSACHEVIEVSLPIAWQAAMMGMQQQRELALTMKQTRALQMIEGWVLVGWAFSK